MSWHKELPINAISVDSYPLNRDGLATALAWSKGVDMPPINVIQNADGSYRIKDGRHRILAAKLNGAKRIWCKVLYRIDSEGSYYAGENFTQPVERYSNINVTKKRKDFIHEGLKKN